MNTAQALGALVAAPGAQTLPGAPSGASSGTGQEFLSLVRQLLGQAAPTPAGGGAATAPGEAVTDEKADQTEEAADATGGDEDAAVAGQVPVTDAPVLPAALAQAVAPAPVPTPDSGKAAGDGDLTGVADATAGARSARTGTTTGPLPTPAVDGPATDAPAAGARAEAAPMPAAPATTTPSGVTPVAQVAAPAAPAPVTTTAAQLSPVAQQVFPEVVRVAGNGEGTHRVTLRLQPEFLGEVRVVLTSRKGELQVSLSAGPEARHALTQGAPELRRLLESIGSADARIVIRDLPVAPAPGVARQDTVAATASVRTDVPTDLFGGSNAGRSGGSTPDQQAHQHGSSTATDGTPDATTPSRRTESVTRARAAGLDVTM
jgi:hypothetical protein